MRLTRIYLRNYRVYEDPVELEIPPGLVGIYGLNGAGKSSLIESIRFSLYGRSRTSIDEVRTSGVNAECIAEVEFEHEGHIYSVRRSIAGINSTVRAQAFADGLQVAEGVRDTTRYVHSVLGMDDSAFRASVFAEQKQLAAFSQQTPAERRKLVLTLLGITPLDGARDTARRDARVAMAQFERMRLVLPDLNAIRAALAESTAALALAEGRVVDDEAAALRAQADLETALGCQKFLEERREEHDRLVREMVSVTAERDRAAQGAAKLAAEVAELGFVAARIEGLAPLAEGWKAADERLRLVEAVVAAQIGLDRLAPSAPATVPDEDACDAAVARAAQVRAELAAVNAHLDGARAERERRGTAMVRSAELDGEADCPLCGQALGPAFASVQAHRAAELSGAEAMVIDLELDQRRAAQAATAAAEVALNMTRQLKGAREAWAEQERTESRRADAAARLATAQAALGRPLGEGERAHLAAEVERRRQAADELPRLQGRLERRKAATDELDVERAALAESTGRLESVMKRAAGLGFSPDALTTARAACEEARRRREAAAARLAAGRTMVAQAQVRTEAEGRRLQEASDQHSHLEELGDEARHLARLGDLLNSFRNTLVASVGPRLSIQAAALFAELTDHDYDHLSVDPETYELKVTDNGRLYGMDRFSGSETDLANLALRVAVSEHVRFQSGGSVGLLVLDEVFGPLDDDRKNRMLLALERLRARFRQVLVVTHDAAIKEQLPSAIEVMKLPGRRATARVING